MSTTTYLLEPNLANDNVVHTAIDRLPGVHLVRLLQHQRDAALGLHLDRLAPKAKLRIDRAMHHIVRRLGVPGADGRVVRHLLVDDARLARFDLELERLAKQRIERLVQTQIVRGVS